MIHTLSFSPAELPELSPRATLVEWLVGVGELVQAGQLLFRYEVDKAMADFIAPQGGWLRRHLAREGERLPRRQPVAVVSDAPDETLAHAPAPPPPTSDVADLYAFDWSEIDCLAGPPEPLDPMRRVIAERMVMSRRHIPCFYLTAVVDMTGCFELRNQMRQAGRKATFNDMAIKASALALTRHPKVASIYLPEGVAPRTEMNIGFAAALPDDGLVVPVVKAADRKSLLDIAGETRLLATKAKKGVLAPEDCRGGVFSVSYLGAYEVDNFVAIVNPGEAAILAVGKTTDTPVVREGRIEIRPTLKITLSSDHRSIDGALAARFVGEVKGLLEQPQALV